MGVGGQSQRRQPPQNIGREVVYCSSTAACHLEIPQNRWVFHRLGYGQVLPSVCAVWRVVEIVVGGEGIYWTIEELLLEARGRFLI